MFARLFAVLVVCIGIATAADAADSIKSPTVVIVAEKDGSLQIEGVNYRAGKALKIELESIAARKPRPDLAIALEKGTDFRTLSRATTLILSTGVFPKIAFLVEPSPK